jgi:hypothetical protein
VLSARLGLRADAQEGSFDVRPTPGAGTIRVSGLRFAGAPRALEV